MKVALSSRSLRCATDPNVSRQVFADNVANGEDFIVGAPRVSYVVALVEGKGVHRQLARGHRIALGAMGPRGDVVGKADPALQVGTTVIANTFSGVKVKLKRMIRHAVVVRVQSDGEGSRRDCGTTNLLALGEVAASSANPNLTIMDYSVVRVVHDVPAPRISSLGVGEAVEDRILKAS